MLTFAHMKFSPGQQVIALDTDHKPAGSAIVQTYHPETKHYTVLFQYPGSSAPESIPIPQERVIIASQLAPNS
jgi:hypothetical protein